jgi:hypothetical protein
VHRNELLVATQQTMNELTCLLDGAPEYKRPINRRFDRYQELVAS